MPAMDMNPLARITKVLPKEYIVCHPDLVPPKLCALVMLCVNVDPKLFARIDTSGPKSRGQDISRVSPFCREMKPSRQKEDVANARSFCDTLLS